MTYNSIKVLRELLINDLSKCLKKKRYHILDFPNYINIGDHLIFKGIIDACNFFDCEIVTIQSHLFFNEKLIKPGDTILFTGGGNFGDLWRKNQNFREYVIEKFPDNEIVILSQSIQYNDNQNIKKSFSVLNKHKNLTIFARDKYSLEILNKNFTGNFQLLPDLAFFSTYNPSSKAEKKVFYLNRIDKEKNKFENSNTEYDTSDWPTYSNDISQKVNRKLIRYNNSLSQKLSRSKLSSLINPSFGILPVINSDVMINQGVKLFSKYEVIVSNRLHGHILALLLGKKSILLDNSYGKNSRFYEAWLKDIPDSIMIGEHDNLEEVIIKLL